MTGSTTQSDSDASKHPLDRHNAILAELRGQIVSGVYRPGDRIEPRHELGERFGTTMATIQKALGALERAGFVESRGRAGTFVTDHPPHLSRYALVFSTPRLNDDGVPPSQFFATLGEQAVVLSKRSTRQITCHYGIDSHVDTESFRTLMGEVRLQRLAGLIFVTPYHVRESPLMDVDIPRVGIHSVRLAGLPIVSIPTEEFIDKAMAYFRARGRRRVAVVITSQREVSYGQLLEKSAAAHGLELRSEWLLGLNSSYPRWADRAAKLLVSARHRADRPDALFITDDHLADAVTRGVLDAGLSIPGDIDVVAHANFPQPTPTVTPLVRLGPDVARVLSACVDLIDAQRQGRRPSAFTQLPVLFEHELFPTSQARAAVVHTAVPLQEA
jgi:DNA-binding LacI/PurR family transcriptional regulator